MDTQIDSTTDRQVDGTEKHDVLVTGNKTDQKTGTIKKRIKLDRLFPKAPVTAPNGILSVLPQDIEMKVNLCVTTFKNTTELMFFLKN